MAIDENVRAQIRAGWADAMARLADGALVRDVAARIGASKHTMAAYLAEVPQARVEYEAAREASANAFMDEALDEARRDVGKELAQHVRTRIDTLKWAARIRNPRLYGEKSQVDVNVRTVDLTAIIRDANARLERQQGARIINAAPIALPDTGNNAGVNAAHTHTQQAIEHAALLAAGLL